MRWRLRNAGMMCHHYSAAVPRRSRAAWLVCLLTVAVTATAGLTQAQPTGVMSSTQTQLVQDTHATTQLVPQHVPSVVANQSLPVITAAAPTRSNGIGLIQGRFWLGVNLGVQNVIPFNKAPFNMSADQLKALHLVSCKERIAHSSTLLVKVALNNP